MTTCLSCGVDGMGEHHSHCKLIPYWNAQKRHLLPQRAKTLLDKDVNDILNLIVDIYKILYIIGEREMINSTSTYDIKIKYVFV